MGTGRLKGISETRSGTRSRLQANESAKHDEHHHHFLCARKESDERWWVSLLVSVEFQIIPFNEIKILQIYVHLHLFIPVPVAFLCLRAIIQASFSRSPFCEKTLNEFCCLYQATIAELLRNVFALMPASTGAPKRKQSKFDESGISFVSTGFSRSRSSFALH